MQQLSSRDCDKWLSMTLTMKEWFSSAQREERELVEKGRQRKNKRGMQLESCVASGVRGVFA